jgi:hypothetical protein
MKVVSVSPVGGGTGRMSRKGIGSILGRVR